MDVKAEQLKRLHHHIGSSPLILFLLGFLSLLFWIAVTLVQIQTSEYLALGVHSHVTSVAWSILSQPWAMITGTAPIGAVTSWAYAWVVELVTLVFALVLSVAIAKIRSINPYLVTAFVLGSLILIFLNGYADYSASPGTTPLVQFLIALALGGWAVIGLPLGIGLIEHGVEELK